MFRIISLVGYIIVFVWILLDIRSKPDDLERVKKWFSARSGQLLTSLKQYKVFSNLDALKKFVYIWLVLFVAIMAFTGFVPHLIFGKALSGVLLMIHVTIAPFFALCATLLALMLAQDSRFFSHELAWIKNSLGLKGETDTFDAETNFSALTKIYFWLLTLLAFTLMFSILLSMFHLFGTPGQEFLLQLHRYSALLFSFALLGQIYLLILNKARTIEEDK